MRVAQSRSSSMHSGEEQDDKPQTRKPSQQRPPANADSDVAPRAVQQSDAESDTAASAPSAATRPWAPGEVETEMAELAPRSAKRAAQRRPNLASCGVDLVEWAREGRLDRVICREAEISRALQILARRTKNNVCLIGAPGVGKTAVVEAIAQRIAEGLVPPQLKECREVWSLDIGALLAGTGLRGDFEERLRGVLAEVRSSEGAVLLFIDELHLVLGAGRSESNNVDAANLMKPMLARGELRCIGATTTDEYQRLIAAKDAAFERRFQVVEVAEPSPAVASEMLRGLIPAYAQHHGLQISSSIAEASVAASVRWIHGRSLPDKAIDILDEACCLATAEGSEETTSTHVETVAARWTSLRARQAGAGTLPERILEWFRTGLPRSRL